MSAEKTEIERLRAELKAMTAARDAACGLLERCIDELATHEEDPDMMWGHREMLAQYRQVGKD